MTTGAAMRRLRAGWMRGAAVALSFAAVASAPARAEQPAPSSRVALVIGEGAYRAGPLPAAPDDAGLVAQVLAGAGFDVTGARDLDGDGMRRAFRDFLDRAGAAGPDGIAVVYFAGRAIQSDGEDFLVPVDARLARPADVAIEALRLADFTHALAALPIQARVVIVDGAYPGGPASSAPGLALMDAEQGELLAFDAGPGTVAPATSGPYGAYAQALAAAMQQGGVPVDEVFDRVRLAVNRSTGGAVVPWDADKLTRSFAFFDRAPGAPAAASAQVPFAALERRPLGGFPPDQAYDVAIARDTLPAYTEFLAAFPSDPLARRVRLILAVRREALFWRAALGGNTPGAYWTYLARYPSGPHAPDARRRLTRLAAAASPPPRFAPLAFDVPPPGPDDVVYDRVIVLDAPDLPPPPPPPVFLLPPLVAVAVQRPPPPPGPMFLPVPVPVAIPYVRPPVEPGAIAPPRGVVGGYPRPRPYARGPNGDGLVVQAAPAQDARPRPQVPAPNVAPPVPAAPQGGPPPRGSAPPLPVQVSPAASPTPAQPPAPRPPTQPVPPSARPLPVPAQPSAPTPPTLPVPPAAAPRQQPVARPPLSAPATPPATVPIPPAAQAVSPPSAAPPPPNPAGPRAPTTPVAPPPAPRPQPAAKPRMTPPAAAVPMPAAPVSTPRPAAPAPRPAAPPAAEPTSPTPRPPAPAAPPEAAPHRPAIGPAAPKPGPAPIPQPPAQRPAPERPPEAPHVTGSASPPAAAPQAAAPGHPAGEHPAAEHPPGERRPACGHSGEPPCRP